MTRTIDTLLFAGNVDLGRVEFRPTAVSSGSELEVLIRSAIGQASPRVVIVLRDFDGEVQLDRSLFGHAIRNLVENGLKYSPAPSPVHVVVRVRRGRLSLAVADRGIASPRRTGEGSSMPFSGRPMSAPRRVRARAFHRRARSPSAWRGHPLPPQAAGRRSLCDPAADGAEGPSQYPGAITKGGYRHGIDLPDRGRPAAARVHRAPALAARSCREILRGRSRDARRLRRRSPRSRTMRC